MTESSLASRIAFRFAAPYFLLYSLYIAYYPVGLAYQWLAPAWDALARLVGRVVLRIEEPIVLMYNGSGDTTADYVRAFTFALLAAIVCVIWTALEREREYPRFAAWLTTWARYWLATWMVIYGAGKIIPPRQFPEPDLVTLSRTYGESSPMGLAWTFMGYSQGYTMFTGAAELLGGVLLLFRRTTTLGALVCVGVMANVVALNFFYDIPVKLFSSHLLAVAVVIAALDGRRLVDVFWRGAAVPPRTTEPVLAQRPRLRKGLKVGYILVVVASLLLQQGSMMDGPKSTFSGIYEVVDDEVTCDAEVECAPEDMAPMHRVVFGTWDRLAFHFVGAPRRVYRAEYTEELGMMTLKSSDEELPVWTFEWSGDELRLDGRLGTARHRVTLRPTTETYLLEERGFRWINETPFNR